MSKGDKYLYSNGWVKGPVTKEKPIPANFIEDAILFDKEYEYAKHIVSLPSIKVEGNHNWKEGQELILNVDFKIKCQFLSNDKWWDAKEVSDYYRDDIREVAIPIQSAQAEKGWLNTNIYIMPLQLGRLEVNCFNEDSEMSIRVGKSSYESLTVDEAKELASFIVSHIKNETEANSESPSKPAEPKKGEAEMQKEIDAAHAIIKKIFDEGLISDDEKGREVWHEYKSLL